LTALAAPAYGASVYPGSAVPGPEVCAWL
jgi:hypothetical protein